MSKPKFFTMSKAKQKDEFIERLLTCKLGHSRLPRHEFKLLRLKVLFFGGGLGRINLEVI